MGSKEHHPSLSLLVLSVEQTLLLISPTAEVRSDHNVQKCVAAESNSSCFAEGGEESVGLLVQSQDPRNHPTISIGKPCRGV